MRNFNFHEAQQRQNEFMRNPFKPDMVSVWGARIIALMYAVGAIGVLGYVVFRELIKSR